MQCFFAPCAQTDASFEDYQAYLRGVITYTFGAGIGLAVLIWLLMFCCCCINCCRGPSSDKKTSSALYSALQQRMEKLEGQSQNQKALWVGLGIIMVIQLACAAGVYIAMGETNVYIVDLYEGTQDLTVDFANFLCSDQDVDDNTNCNDDTIGDFIEDAKVEINNGFDSMVEWLDSLDIVTESVDQVGVAVDDLNDDADTLQQQVLWLDGNSTLAIDKLNYLSDPANTGGIDFSAYMPDPDDVPTLGADTIENVEDGMELLSDTADTLADLQDSLVQILDEEVQEIVERIDGEGEDDDRKDIMETLDDLLDSVFDFQADVLDADDSMEDAKDTLEINLQHARHGATGLFAIPALLLLCCTCTGWRCKSGRPLRLNMCFNFFCQEFCAIVTGLMMLSAIIVTDFCDSHVQVIQVNLNNSVTIGDSKVMLGDVVMDVLTCSGDTNLADILKITEEFNVSSYTEKATDEIDDALEEFMSQYEQVDEVTQESQDSVDSLTDIEIDDSGLDDVMNDVEEMLEALPDSPYNDTTENEAKLELIYGSEYDIDDPTEKEAAIALNDQIVADVNVIMAALLNIEDLTADIDVTLDQIDHDYAAVLNATANLTATLDIATGGLDVVKDGLQEIVDFVATGPEYLGCAFIGDFYAETIEGTMCTDLENSLTYQYIPMLLLTIFILISFCYSGYYTPHLKKQQGAPKQVQPDGVSPQGDIQLMHVRRVSDPLREDDMTDIPPPGKGDRVV